MKRREFISSLAGAPLAGFALTGLVEPIEAMASPQVTNGVIKIDDFGTGPGLGSGHNSTPAFDSAVSYAKSNPATVKTILFSAGNYYFNTQPYYIRNGIEIAGFGRGRTYLFRNYSTTDAEHAIISFRHGANGSIVRDLGIVATANSNSGSAISIVSTSASTVGYLSFENLFLSVNNTSNKWRNTIYVNGTSTSLGVANIDFVNCSVFGAQSNALELLGVTSFNFNGGGVFSAGGASGNIFISGGSSNVVINTSHLAGYSIGSASGVRVEKE